MVAMQTTAYPRAHGHEQVRQNKVLSDSCKVVANNRALSAGPCLIGARLWTWVVLLGWRLWWVQNLLQAPCQVTATCSMVSSVIIMLLGTVIAEMCDVPMADSPDGSHLPGPHVQQPLAAHASLSEPLCTAPAACGAWLAVLQGSRCAQEYQLASHALAAAAEMLPTMHTFALRS